MLNKQQLLQQYYYVHQPHLALAGGLPGEAFPQHSHISGRPSDVNHNGIWYTREEGRTPHAIGGTGGEGEYRILGRLFSTANSLCVNNY